jgi:hypothetical protein
MTYSALTLPQVWERKEASVSLRAGNAGLVALAIFPPQESGVLRVGYHNIEDTGEAH